MASSPVDSKVFEAIKELVVTEYKYLRSLKTMQDLFARPLSPSFVSPFHIMGSQEGGGGGDGEGDGHSPPALSHHDWHLMFSKIPQLISLHESILECFMQGLDIHHHHGEDAESRGDNVALDFSVIRFSSNGISLGELGNVFLKHVSEFRLGIILGPPAGHLCQLLRIPNAGPASVAGTSSLQFRL